MIMAKYSKYPYYTKKTSAQNYHLEMEKAMVKKILGILLVNEAEKGIN